MVARENSGTPEAPKLPVFTLASEVPLPPVVVTKLESLYGVGKEPFSFVKNVELNDNAPETFPRTESCTPEPLTALDSSGLSIAIPKAGARVETGSPPRVDSKVPLLLTLPIGFTKILDVKLGSVLNDG